MSTNAVLLAEREPGSREYLERQLRDDGFMVFEAGWTAQALDLAERLSPDVVIAGETDLCRRLRAGEPGRTWDRNVPVIVLTEPGADPVTRVRAFESGADDVVPRDVYLELLARVRALLRRAVLGQADVVEAGPLVVDHRARQVRVDDHPVRLSGREFELAAKLASDPRRVFTKAELLRDVWGIRTNGIRTRTVDSHASRLRRKLEAAGLRRRRQRPGSWLMDGRLVRSGGKWLGYRVGASGYVANPGRCETFRAMSGQRVGRQMTGCGAFGIGSGAG